jgi:monoamine oxidase
VGQQFDAIVAGAGFAGITPARDLADRGFSVLLLEAGDRIGGRTYTRAFRGRSDMVELGGGWISRQLQPHMRREVDRYGVQLKVDTPPEHASFLTGGQLRSAPVPPSALGDLERAWLHLYDASKRISTAQPIHQQPVRDLDVSAETFFAPLDLSDAARDLINAIVVWYNGTHPGLASMLPLIAQTAAFGFSPLGFYGALQERFVGGTRELLERMVAEGTFELRLREPVAAVSRTDDGVMVTTGGGETLTAGACVVAVPTNVMRHIDFSPELAPRKREVLSERHVCSGYKVTVLAENLPQRPFAVGVGALQVICVGHELDDGQYLLIGFGAEDYAHLDPLSHDEVAAAVPQYFPRIMNEPEGRIVFAGTDLDDSVWRTWMEGALNSGHAAAHRVQGLLGSPGDRQAVAASVPTW